jgi:hypothetical protein
MDYGKLISDSWRITWNNKFLWVLGFLAALTSVSSGSNSGRSVSEQFGSNDVSPEMLTAVSGALLLLLCIGFAIGIIIMLVSLAANGGLISAVARLDNGEKVTLGEAFGAGTQALFRLFGVSFLLWLPFMLFFAVAAGIGVISIGGIAATAELANDLDSLIAGLGIVLLCMVALCCALIPLGIVISVVHDFAIRGTMLRGLGVIESIRHGWQIIRANIGEVIILMLILFGVALAYGIVVGIIMLPLGLMLFVPVAISAGSGGIPEVGSAILLIGGGICLGILGALLNSVLVTWRSAAITLAYRQFATKELNSEMA